MKLYLVGSQQVLVSNLKLKSIYGMQRVIILLDHELAFLSPTIYGIYFHKKLDWAFFLNFPVSYLINKLSVS